MPLTEKESKDLKKKLAGIANAAAAEMMEAVASVLNEAAPPAPRKRSNLKEERLREIDLHMRKLQIKKANASKI